MMRRSMEHGGLFINQLRAQNDQLHIQLMAAEIQAQKYRGVIQHAAIQFQFYADEHTKAGKAEKAATNQKFASMLIEVLKEGSR